MGDARPFVGFICPTCNHADEWQAGQHTGRQAPSCSECGTTMRYRDSTQSGHPKASPQRRTQTYKR
jgi:Zn ribbon nucleic-acid-binding protein